MGDTLSQAEIDSLLNALSTGEINPDELNDVDERVVKNYDFARPSKFSKDHLRTLEIIFEKLAGVFKKKCSGRSNECGSKYLF